MRDARVAAASAAAVAAAAASVLTQWPCDDDNSACTLPSGAVKAVVETTYAVHYDDQLAPRAAKDPLCALTAAGGACC